MTRRSLLLTAAGAAVSYAQGQSARGSIATPASGTLEAASIYQVWLRSFTPEGTLAAAALRLPHIADLGATIVLLSPLQLHSQEGGFSNPYRQKDYDVIDPEYGTETDLRAFVDQAHKLGLRVIQDMVFYHTAPDSVLLTKHPEFYLRTADGKPAPGQWRLPRLDFGNLELREYLIRNLLHWIGIGLDGFRFDVAGAIPLQFWEDARRQIAAAKRDVIFVAEAESPEDQAGGVFDISYNFTYLKQALYPVLNDGEPASRIRECWERQKADWPQGARLLYGSDNHDQRRAIAVFGRRASWAATVLSFALDGIPFLYNGQEIEDTTPTNHQAHAAMPWHIGPRTTAGSGQPFLARRQQAAFDRHKALFALRRAEPALNSGELLWVRNSAPAHVLSFLRRQGTDEILVIVNLSNRRLPVEIDIAAADFFPAVDLLTGKRRGTDLASRKIAFRSIQAPNELQAFEALYLKRQKPARDK